MTEQPQIFLGIDPGTLFTGFGVVACSGDKLWHVAHGTIVLDKKKAIADRLADLAVDLATLVDKYRPHHGIVEDVFLFKNARSALILGQARGAVLAVLGMRGVGTTSYSPTTVKSLIAGSGQAKKFQVALMVSGVLNIALPSSADAADALAIAVAGVFGSKIAK